MSDRKEIMAARLQQAWKDAGHESATATAQAFGWTPSTFTHHQNGTRPFDVDTAVKYGKALKVNPGWLLALDQIEAQVEPVGTLRQKQVPFWGKVAAGVWRETTFVEPEGPPMLEIDSFADDYGELFAVEPEGPSMNKTIPEGTILICRRVPFGLTDVTPGDLVIVQRHNHDLREATCKRLALIDGEFYLQSESHSPEFQNPIRIGKPDHEAHIDVGIEVIGVVLRYVGDLRRTKSYG